MTRKGWLALLQGLPLKGRFAILCGAAAVGLPTLVRVSVNGIVTGCEFTPYLPFLLISAILLRWWQAAAVALVSTGILGGLFGGSHAPDLECFMSAAGIFLASSAAIIGIAAAVRHIIVVNQGRREGSRGGIIFSLEKGEVWASWYGQGLPIHLGSEARVSEMMEDFLAQTEVAKRLNRPR